MLASKMHFTIGHLPFLYLGDHILMGRPKVIHFQLIVDKIRDTLASQKSHLVSIIWRLLLVKSVIQSMLIHTLMTYSWLISLLQIIERWCKYFIWSGNISKRKMVTVYWKKCCQDFVVGGLRIRSMTTLNEASNLLSCWRMEKYHDHQALILRARVYRKNIMITRPLSLKLESIGKVVTLSPIFVLLFILA